MRHRNICLPCMNRCTIPGLTLIGFWFAGVSLGLWAARFYGDSVRELAIVAGQAELSLRHCLVVTVLPLFLSAFAVLFFHRFGAYLFTLIRGGILGFLLGILTSVGGLWLVFLLLFSAVAVSPVLLWFFWRRLCMGQDGCRRDLVCAFMTVLGISAVDHWVVAPFLAHALSF